MPRPGDGVLSNGVRRGSLAALPRTGRKIHRLVQHTRLLDSEALNEFVIASLVTFIGTIRVGIAAFCEQKFNKSQQRAIRSSLKDGNGFFLVQGPPGTGMVIGKTSMCHTNHTTLRSATKTRLRTTSLRMPHLFFLGKTTTLIGMINAVHLYHFTKFHAEVVCTNTVDKC